MGEAATCPQCGASLRTGAKICTSCGATIAAARPSAGAQEERPNKKLFWILLAGGLLILVLIVTFLSRPGRESAGGGAPWGPGESGGEGVVEPLRFTDYTNKNFNFTTRLPVGWEGSVSDEALVFSGSEDTEQYLTMIKFKFVTNATGSSLEGQADELEADMSEMNGFEVLSREPASFAGNPAIRMVLGYDAPEGVEQYRQEQIIMEHGLYYYYISYTAPLSLFDDYKFVMDEVLDSFSFS